MRRRGLLAASGRRGVLTAVAMLAGCSVLPDRPYQEVRRFPLSPERAGSALPPPPRGPVLLLRSVRAAPGLEQRGLRRLGATGNVAVAAWEEWAAPPAELAEAALRRWLGEAGLFAAVIPPGSRLDPALVLEVELTRLEVDAAGAGRAGLSVLLLSEPTGLGGSRVRGQFLLDGAAPAEGGPAATMAAALGGAFVALEARLRDALAPEPQRARAAR